MNRRLTFEDGHKRLMESGKLDPKKRYQSGLTTQDILPPQNPGYCHCGCGEKLTGRKTRWASTRCSAHVVYILSFLQGNADTIRGEAYLRDKGVCAKCGRNAHIARKQAHAKWCAGKREEALDLMKAFGGESLKKTWWQADHIKEVQDGGGACLMDNIQTLCCSCHKRKSRNYECQNTQKGRSHR